jgi:hypothetical protein
MSWEIEAEEDVLKGLQKLGPNERECLLYNLQVYHDSMNTNKNPIHVQHGFLHPEPMGIRAIDQGGGALPGGKKRPKMKELRLYTYSDLKLKKIHLLCLGDKAKQSKDIQLAKKRVEKIRKASEEIS